MNVNEITHLADDIGNAVTSDTQTVDTVELTDSQLDQISGGRIFGGLQGG